MKISIVLLSLMAVGAGLGAYAFGAAPTAPAPAVTSQPAKGQVPAATASETTTPEQLYNASSLRDPFVSFGSVASAVRSVSPVAAAAANETFSIHSLYLRGIMRDTTGDWAVLVSQAGATYILKKGRLLNFKHKVVPGVTGKVFSAQKKVILETPDKDVQTLILGEDNKEGL